MYIKLENSLIFVSFYHLKSYEVYTCLHKFPNYIEFKEIKINQAKNTKVVLRN